MLNKINLHGNNYLYHTLRIQGYKQPNDVLISVQPRSKLNLHGKNFLFPIALSKTRLATINSACPKINLDLNILETVPQLSEKSHFKLYFLHEAFLRQTVCNLYKLYSCGVLMTVMTSLHKTVTGYYNCTLITTTADIWQNLFEYILECAHQ